MSNTKMVIGFNGPRQISSAVTTINILVRNTLTAGCDIAVGCATGVDTLVLAAALLYAKGQEERIHVFALFDRVGRGSWSASNLRGVQRAASSGANVRWRAGGEFQGNIPATAIRRSQALVQFLSDSGPGSGLVAITDSPPKRNFTRNQAWPSCGSGTWGTVAAANYKRLPVAVFPVNWPDFQRGRLPQLPGSAGVWVEEMGQFGTTGGYRWQRED